LSHAVAHCTHFLVVLGIAGDLVVNGGVLFQEAFGVGQRLGLVFAGDLALSGGQPGLEVVEVAEESLEITGLVQLGLLFADFSVEQVPD
jgi:hypothetical protein